MSLSFTFGYDENGKITIVKSDSAEAKSVKPRREYKGVSKLEFIQDYIVLDFETTGLDPKYDSIIEIGAIKVIGGAVVDKYTTLVKPLCGISDFITELTGITSDMLLEAPEIEDVLPTLLSFIGDGVIVAHNANFDINFLYDNCLSITGNAFTNDFIDTMRVSRRLFKDFNSHRLVTLVEALGLNCGVEHRSLADCMCAYNLYEYMKKYTSENNINTSIAFAGKGSNPLRAADVITSKDEFDETHPLYGKVCVFTGALENFTRKEAMQIVADLGGINGDNVTKKTNFLILGNNDYCTQIKDGKSNKQKKAEEFILSGKDLAILSESAFYDML